MSGKKLTIVSINSRKGGVGKTSIGLSAAAQLAAIGKKVAFIDLDTLGTHLAQCLPIAGVACETKNRAHLSFQRDDADRTPPIVYRERPYLFWWLAGRSQTRRQERGVAGSGERLLVSGSCLKLAKEKQVDARLMTMAENLTVFPASCYVTDLDEVNRMVIGTDGRLSYENFLSDLMSKLASDDYDFVFIDNSPGLSLNGAMSLNWAIRQARASARSSSLQTNVRTWIASLSSWWEQGLLEYELNVFGEDLSRTHPVLIVNRVGDSGWLDARFAPGTCTSSRVLWDAAKHEDESAAGSLAELKSLFFNLPLWMGAERNTDDLLMDFVIPHELRIAVLGEDTKVAAAGTAEGFQVRDQESTVKNVPANNGELRWGRRSDEFFSRFFIPAVAPHESEGTDVETFHSQVWTALVKPLLAEE